MMTAACESDTAEMVRQLSKGQFVAGIDPREQALYTPGDAACYLGIHPQTLSNWLWGRNYKTLSGERRFDPLIDVADDENQLLSFFNLAELHVLAATRYKHHVPFVAIRSAMDTVQKQFRTPHPLISRDFKTNGLDIFIQGLDETSNISRPWQLNFKVIMDTFLEHVVSDEHDFVRKIFPLIAGQPDDRMISITYGISSSQPVVDGAGVPVEVIRNRFVAGEPVEDIAEDFDISVTQVRRAIDYLEQRPS